MVFGKELDLEQKARTGTHMSGFPTNQDLEGIRFQSFIIALN